MLIGKDPVEDQYFLAIGVIVHREGAAGVIPDNRGDLRFFRIVANAFKPFAPDGRARARLPGHRRAAQHDALGKIAVKMVFER